MELGLSNTLLAGDPRLIDHIVGEVKSQGIFDQFRKECIADVDTKPAYQNLRMRVEGSVNSFLSKQSWKPDLNKNQLRENLRKHIHEASYLDVGVERIVDQVVNPKVYSVFMPQIEDVVYKFLGLEKPKSKEKSGICGLKDLLPKDLDPVSPESDKNSLKDVSLESVDGIDELDSKRDKRPIEEQIFSSVDNTNERNRENNPENGQISFEEKLDESNRSLNKNNSNTNMNTSTKSDDKTEEEEEDSPTFEPIDIMNLNESNISNDSHLSGISELTSHRSRSPDFCNDLSRDNFDYSNQDSHLSKVSSDSRLSIVTDFGLSNHALTPIHDQSKEDVSRDKSDSRGSKDNFKAIRDETNKNKNSKSAFEINKYKDAQDVKDAKDNRSVRNSLSSKENSRDGMESSTKEKSDHKSHKEKSKDEYAKSKSGKDKNHVKDSKYYKDGDKKKQSSHSSSKYDKHNKHKSKEKSEPTKENSEKAKDVETKESSRKSKDDNTLNKDIDKKDNINKEMKDLKDLYKEKIRELREKKELTEKEKLNKDNREAKPSKESKEKRDSSKDKKYKKDHKSSSSSKNSVSSHDSKMNKTEKLPETKDRKSESKDRAKRDEKYSTKDNSKDKVDKSKTNIVIKSDSIDKSEKVDPKRTSKNEKEESIRKDKITEKISNKKDIKNYVPSKDRSSKSDVKTDAHSKDKKRRDDKKSKLKDDHASLRKNSHDRRSTDRDGSNGSNSKSSQSSNSSSNSSTNKTGVTSLSRETSQINNSNSEASDSIEEAQINEMKSFTKLSNEFVNEEQHRDTSDVQSSTNDSNLPLKKRPLFTEGSSNASNEIKIKKPKFAKNIHEAKKLMKIRKQLEKQKLKETKKMDKKQQQQRVEPVTQIASASNNNNDLERVPDEERVQIIEVPDEEYEEPYPEKQTNLTLEDSIIMLGEPCANDLLRTQFELKVKLSETNQTITETICKKTLSDDTSVMQQIDSQTGKETTEDAEKQPAFQQAEIATETLESHETSAVEQTIETKLNKGEISEDKTTETVTENEETLPTISTVIAANAKEFSTLEASTSGIDKDEEIKKRQMEEDRVTPRETEDSTKVNDVALSTVKSSEESKEGNDLNPSSESDKQTCTMSSNDDQLAIESTSKNNEDRGDCRYFKADNEKSEKFSNFLESLELVENSTLEDIIESLGGQVVSSVPKSMAPPLPKRKHSSSPLSDTLLNNTNNNNNGQKQASMRLPSENSLHTVKKRKVTGPKKQRAPPPPPPPPLPPPSSSLPQQNIGNQQGLLNGENFVMPLSPESDVSATSEKTSTNVIKEEKSRHRSSQRYSSDDLYKPRPLFSSSSRRSRRSNQA